MRPRAEYGPAVAGVQAPVAGRARPSARSPVTRSSTPVSKATRTASAGHELRCLRRRAGRGGEPL